MVRRRNLEIVTMAFDEGTKEVDLSIQYITAFKSLL